MNTEIKKTSAAGFTLLEVLIAMAVFAIAAAALLSGLNESVRSEQYIEQRTLAHWVGLNQLSTTRLQPVWPDVGVSDGKTEMNGVEWLWTRTVSGTADAKLRRVDIAIRLDEESEALANLSGFVIQEQAQLAAVQQTDAAPDYPTGDTNSETTGDGTGDNTDQTDSGNN